MAVHAAKQMPVYLVIQHAAKAIDIAKKESLEGSSRYFSVNRNPAIRKLMNKGSDHR